MLKKIVSSVGNGFPKASEEPDDFRVVPLDSKLGRDRDKTAIGVDKWKLENYFEARKNTGSCADACATTLLNALRIGTGFDLPQDQTMLPKDKREYLPKGFVPIFEKYTPNLIAKKSKGEMAKDFGPQLRQLHELFKKLGAHSVIRVVSPDLKADRIKKELIEVLTAENKYLVVNYSGHMSSVADYDPVSDSFLVLDVNTVEAPWSWIDGDTLIDAMKIRDCEEIGGYLIVEEGANGFPKAPEKPDDFRVVPLDSKVGRDRDKTAIGVDKWKLENHFEAQDNKVFCALACAAIILNALRLGTKFDPILKRYTQKLLSESGEKSLMSILGKPTKNSKGEMATDYGLQLRQLHELFKKLGLHSVIKVVSHDLKADRIKKELIKVLATKNKYLVVNYSRSVVGQARYVEKDGKKEAGWGHMSPVAAYDPGSDSYLVLDVNTVKAPWSWIDGDTLIDAMNTHDYEENRGYLIVEEGGKERADC